MLPLASRRAAQEVGGARLGHQGGALPAGAALAAEAQPRRRDQRDADDVAEFRPVAMPADAGADIIFDDEHMAQRFGRKAGETSGAVADRKEESRNGFGLAKPAAVKGIMEPERGPPKLNRAVSNRRVAL